MIPALLTVVALARASDVDADADGLPDRYDPCPSDMTNAIVGDTCADGTRARPTVLVTPAADTAVASSTPTAPPVAPDPRAVARARKQYRTSRATMWLGMAALPVGAVALVAGAERIAEEPRTISAGTAGLVLGGAVAVLASPGVTAGGVFGQRRALADVRCERENDSGDLVAIGTLAATYLFTPSMVVAYPYTAVHAFGMDVDARTCGVL